MKGKRVYFYLSMGRGLLSDVGVGARQAGRSLANYPEVCTSIEGKGRWGTSHYQKEGVRDK